MTGQAKTFAEIEAAYEQAREAVEKARWRERVIWEELHAARCNEDFGPAPRGIIWRCTLEAGHDGAHSNVFSRGEREAAPPRRW